MPGNSKVDRINAAKIARDAQYKTVTDILSAHQDDAELIAYVKDQAAKILRIDDVSSLNIPIILQTALAEND